MDHVLIHLCPSTALEPAAVQGGQIGVVTIVIDGDAGVIRLSPLASAVKLRDLFYHTDI